MIPFNLFIPDYDKKKEPFEPLYIELEIPAIIPEVEEPEETPHVIVIEIF